MGRIAPTQTYIQPIKSDGTLAAPGSDSTLGTSNRGVYTLEAGATYYVPIPADDAQLVSLQTQGDAEVVFTSVTIEESNIAPSEASNHADADGEWFATDIARITSASEGAGWSNANDVIAAAGGARGGGIQNVQDAAARRLRAKVVVGASGGQARFSWWAKE